MTNETRDMLPYDMLPYLEEHNRKPSYWKIWLGVGVALGLVFAVNEGIKYASERTERELSDYFRNWKTVGYIDPRLAFQAEDIGIEDVSLRDELRSRYLHEVEKRNKFDAEGRTADLMINLPDLDGDGKVGKEEFQK